jgi:hypothetical protein
MPRLKVRKIRHRCPKFFGWKKDRWARLGGRHGKKCSYGHLGDYMCDNRTRAEIRNADDRREAHVAGEG